MIVIPPSTVQEKYFKAMAENSWKAATNNHKEKCEALKAENTTMVITCKVEVGGGMETNFHLHYRYFRKMLYCFVEEEEPTDIQTP